MTINHPSFVGFDRIFDELDRIAHGKPNVCYPPHNLIKLGDHQYNLELAIAGYTMDDIEIVLEKSTLTIKTKDEYKSPDSEVNFIYKGISAKKFKKAFTLADNVEILGADLDNGILTIRMCEIIPEEDQPKVIKINHKGEKSEPKYLTE